MPGRRVGRGGVGICDAVEDRGRRSVRGERRVIADRVASGSEVGISRRCPQCQSTTYRDQCRPWAGAGRADRLCDSQSGQGTCVRGVDVVQDRGLQRGAAAGTGRDRVGENGVQGGVASLRCAVSRPRHGHRATGIGHRRIRRPARGIGRVEHGRVDDRHLPRHLGRPADQQPGGQLGVEQELVVDGDDGVVRPGGAGKGQCGQGDGNAEKNFRKPP